jgi:hypothetical protein
MIKRTGLKKNAMTNKYTGCTSIQLMDHLNNNERGLVFGDEKAAGKLEIDHVRPISNMIKTCELDLRRVSNFHNLQLLPWRENRDKRCTFSDADAARYAEKEGKAIDLLVPGWVAAGVCKCVLCV